MISAASSAPAAAAAAQSSTGTSSTGDALAFTQNFNTFLTLLTTQLKNQDPLSPMDTNQFTQQLVSFSAVEQQINTNKNLTQLIQLQTADETIQSLPLVGKTIEFTGATTALSNGQASFSYTLPQAAAQTALLVKDAGGNVVFATKADGSAGTHSFVWNGQTNGGTQLADGDYSLQVVAQGANNSAIAATISAAGLVTGVSTNNGTTTFDVGGVAVPIGDLVTVRSN